MYTVPPPSMPRPTTQHQESPPRLFQPLRITAFILVIAIVMLHVMFQVTSHRLLQHFAAFRRFVPGNKGGRSLPQRPPFTLHLPGNFSAVLFPATRGGRSANATSTTHRMKIRALLRRSGGHPLRRLVCRPQKPRRRTAKVPGTERSSEAFPEASSRVSRDTRASSYSPALFSASASRLGSKSCTFPQCRCRRNLLRTPDRRWFHT